MIPNSSGGVYTGLIVVPVVLKDKKDNLYTGYSSVGRATVLQAVGQKFKSFYPDKLTDD